MSRSERYVEQQFKALHIELRRIRWFVFAFLLADCLLILCVAATALYFTYR